jgi:glycosyltransferase involved in cell wall biosynthesis
VAADLQLSASIDFLGPVYGLERFTFLSRCAVVASPCPFEIFGLSTAEALAVGTPVVVPAGTGCAEVAGMAGAAEAVDSADVCGFADALLRQLRVPDEECMSASEFVRSFFSLGNYASRVQRSYGVQV